MFLSPRDVKYQLKITKTFSYKDIINVYELPGWPFVACPDVSFSRLLGGEKIYIFCVRRPLSADDNK